jgi:hypothetical protein
VAGSPLLFPAYVQHNLVIGVLLVRHLAECQRPNSLEPALGSPPGIDHVAAEIASEPVQPNAGQIADQLIDSLDPAIVHDEMKIVVVRQEGAGPGGESAGRRDVEGARHGSAAIFG